MMIDSVKDFVSPKRFSVSAYLCGILHSICGVILIAITSNLGKDETEKFSCAVDTTLATHKTYVEKTCFSNYNDVHDAHVRLFAFVLFSFGSVAVVSVIYSLAVGSRIDETERYSSGRNSPPLNGPNQPGTRTLYVFYFYFFHLVARSIFGMLFTILQFTVLYPTGFDSKFICVYLKLTQPDVNFTTAKNASVPLSSVTCENLAAQDKQFCGYAVFACNVIFTLIMLLEIIYMIKGLIKRERFTYFKPKSWSCDWQFIIKYCLRKQHMPEDICLIGVDIPTPDSVQIYKEKVINAPLTSDINYGLDTNTSLDDMFIDVVIQTEQAPLKFSKDMSRHEINDVYMKVPEHSIRLEEVKDLFYPNEDTKGNSPRTILALGRPGIGKSVLTRKIMHDWANGVDRFYHGKIAFFFKFRWFHFEQLQNVTLKKFLQFGTELSEEEFESVFAKVWAKPQIIIFNFDGLNEFGGNPEKFQDFLDQSKMSPDDATCPTPAMVLFIKILTGQILHKAKVLVTSRPTATDVLSKLHYHRKVEIIGFTEDKIENYVEKFCANHENKRLKPKIWNHIKSSELKNLCYIPVNCFIVCVTLLNCLSDQGNENALPTTLTELYQAALVYFHKNHDRNETKEHYEKVINDLQQLAFHGMENDRLIFDDEIVNRRMKESGLLHCLPVPIFQIQAQVCFIHLTEQEFLAAKHMVETKGPEDLKEFISSHVEDGKWHLVLQFLAGLLGKKMEMFEKYRSCVLAFGEHLLPEIEIKGEDIVYRPSNPEVLMKCVRETENEDIAKEIATTSALKRVTTIVIRSSLLTPSDCAAIAFVCKHLNLLKHLSLLSVENSDCVLEITKLLRHRCFETVQVLLWPISPVQEVLKHVLSAMTTSECCIYHKHSKLAHLDLRRSGITDDDVCILTKFLENAHGVCLKSLNLSENAITSVGLCDVLGHEVCNQLLTLDLSFNEIGDDGMPNLCDTLEKNLDRLRTLIIQGCSVTSAGTFWLGQVFGNKNCEISHLDISHNAKGDEGARMLCDGFRKGNCELDVLDLSYCKLTPACMPYLIEFVEDKNCRLTHLVFTGNDIGDEGVGMLFNALRVKQCSLTKLDLYECSLTKKCMTSLCRALGDEHCPLTYLSLQGNEIRDEGVEMLCCALEKGQCKLNELNLQDCPLTYKCIPSLWKALGDESCSRTFDMKMLLVGRSEHCAGGLKIRLDRSLQNEGILHNPDSDWDTDTEMDTDTDSRFLKATAW